MQRILHLGYFADGPWGHRAFDKIVADDSLIIDFVMVRYDSQDSVLIAKANEHGIPLLLSSNINAPDFVEKLQKIASDLFVSMSFNQIFHREVLSVPRLGTINCHAGKLPYYRGRNILNWALINDEPNFGITVHYVDEGIDTGDIILQDDYPITDADDYGTLLEKAYTGCPDILYRAIKAIQSGKAERQPQAELAEAGLYCGMRRAGDEVIDWRQSSREIFNFVRAVTHPAPGATTFHDGEKITIWRVEEVPGAPCYKGIPGQVLVKDEGKLLIKTGDSYINVLDYEGKLRTGYRLSAQSV